jgi:hypothetical protein
VLDALAVDDTEPLLLLNAARIVPDAVWTAIETQLVTA